jgi:hypothetical protein
MSRTFFYDYRNLLIVIEYIHSECDEEETIMKKFLVLCTLMLLAGAIVFAQGNLERLELLTDLEGIIEISKVAGEQPQVFLVLDDGTKVELEIPEAQKLMFQNQERVKLEGVLLGPSEGNPIAHQLFVRAMNRNGVRTEVENPIQLSQQQRQQQRSYEDEQQELQMRNQNQNQNQNQQQIQQQVEPTQGTKGNNPDNTNGGPGKQGGK